MSMKSKYPRYDGMGVFLLAVTALFAILAALSSSLRFPATADDTGTQASMAWANWAMVSVSISAAIIGAVSLILLRRTWHEAQRSADAAERALLHAEQTKLETVRIGEAQTRAYLIATSAVVDFGIQSIQVRYGFKNSGQTPARSLECYVEIMIHEKMKGSWAPIISIATERKSRSDVAGGASKDGKSERYAFSDDTIIEGDWIKGNFRVVAAIRFKYADVFGRVHDETARYGVYLESLYEGKHTLYRQIGDEGFRFDIFE